MGNQMVTSEPLSVGNYLILYKNASEIFSNFASVPLDYLLTSRVTDYIHNFEIWMPF